MTGPMLLAAGGLVALIWAGMYGACQRADRTDLVLEVESLGDRLDEALLRATTAEAALAAERRWRGPLSFDEHVNDVFEMVKPRPALRRVK